MNHQVYVQLVDGAAGVFLLSAVTMLWRRQFSVLLVLLSLQGAALAAVVALLGVQGGDGELLVVAAGLLVLRAGVLPHLGRRTLGGAPADQRDSLPVVNVAASLLAAALLVMLACAVSWPLIQIERTVTGRLLPVGLATVLIGFFMMVTRRRPLSQVIGLLILDNGITITSFLAAGGVPLVVELAVSFDVLLATVVLGLLTRQVHAVFGTTSLDDMRELCD